MKKTLFIKNALILTVTSIVIRVLGIVFKVWLAGRVGSEGIGLYHLVFSVHLLAAAFASSGLPTAVTRLVTDALAGENQPRAARVLRRGISLAILLSLVGFCAVFFAADFIAGQLLGDARAADGLRVMCFSLPFMGISCILKAYFMARRRVSPNSVAVILEQALRILLCVVLINRIGTQDVGRSCTVVLLCDTVAEALSCGYMAWRFALDRRKLPKLEATGDGKETRELIRIAAPITGGRYLTTALRTLETAVVPRCLSVCLSDQQALSVFGAVKGMALPVLLFPSSLLNALSSLLLPEMAEAVAQNRPFVVKSAVRKTISTTWLLGVLFGYVFLFRGQGIGQLIYHDSLTGELIAQLAPLVPLMYLDSICDGILKGLDQQKYTFFTSTLDGVSRLALILLLVPTRGAVGFVAVMYISNLLTAVLHVGKLLKLTGLKPSFMHHLLLPMLSGGGTCLLLSRLLPGQDLWSLGLYGVGSCLLFLVMIRLLRIIDPADYLR